MGKRCKICGVPVKGVTICNHCNVSLEERRFLKMVNREELKESRNILARPGTTASTQAETFREE